MIDLRVQLASKRCLPAGVCRHHICRGVGVTVLYCGPGKRLSPPVGEPGLAFTFRDDPHVSTSHTHSPLGGQWSFEEACFSKGNAGVSERFATTKAPASRRKPGHHRRPAEHRSTDRERHRIRSSPAPRLRRPSGAKCRLRKCRRPHSGSKSNCDCRARWLPPGPGRRPSATIREHHRPRRSPAEVQRSASFAAGNPLPAGGERALFARIQCSRFRLPVERPHRDAFHQQALAMITAATRAAQIIVRSRMKASRSCRITMAKPLQMLRPTAGTMILSSSINRVNCSG